MFSFRKRKSFKFEPNDMDFALSLLEQHPLNVYWVEIGKRMEILDIPESMEEFMSWIKVSQERFVPL